MLSQNHLETFDRPYNPIKRDPDFTASKILSNSQSNLRSPSLSNQTGLKRVGNSIVSSKDLNSFTLSRPINGTAYNHNNIDTANSIINYSQSRNAFSKANSRLQNGVRSRNTDNLVVKNENPAAEYMDKPKEPERPSAWLIRSIFAIYFVNEGYNSGKRTYGMPDGMGILLNENLCITASSVIPDEETAIHCYAQFRQGEMFKFDPYRCFVTSKEDGFTVLAFKSQTANALKYFRPVKIREQFELKMDEPVFYFPFDEFVMKSVLIIDNNKFTFTSGKKEFILPGTPVFTIQWKLQGMYVRSDGHINIAMRVEPMLQFMEGSLTLLHLPLLEQYLHQDHLGYIEKFYDRYLYYFEWNGQTI